MSMRRSIWTVSFDMFMPTIETALGELDAVEAVEAVELGITIPGAILILDDMPGIFSIVAIAFELWA
jgi:rRNA processing protein Krr1/Pno1